MRDRRRAALVLAASAAVIGSLLTVGQTATAAAPDAPARAYALDDGVTAPIFSYGDAIRESAWVLAPDFDGDGAKDRIGVDIIRPAEPDGTPLDVPVIMDASPYYACCGRGNESELKQYDADGNPVKFPLFYDNYFVPRGYAFVAVDMAGTNRSTGCVDQGAESDIGSVKAVVDWLNGRADAVDAAGEPVAADWTNGKVGMIGKSYDGTLANGVAATGVRGLETIVPVSAISSWYDYDRYQGLPFSYDYPSWLSSFVEQERTENVNCQKINNQMAKTDGDETGAYTEFWSRRDYRATPIPDASRVTASVFITHGLQDTNVKTPNFARWWKVLGDNGVERKMWLSRLGHVDPFDHDRARWVDTLHRWFDHELYGIPNGIDQEPPVSVETSPNHWVDSDRWPMSTQTVSFSARSDGRLVAGDPVAGSQSFVNDPQQSEATAVAPGDNGHRLLYTTDALAHEIRISGSPVVRLRVSDPAKTGQIGVAVVDYGIATRVLTTGDGARNLATESCWGESSVADDACYIDVARRLGETPLQVLARGWARLDGAGAHTVDVELTANDLTVPAGHRLGLVVVAASPSWLVTVDAKATTYTVDLGASELRLPVRGDLGFTATASGLRVPDELPRGTVPRATGRQLPR
ncbi:MAG TPA: CocE/NonD family hydrolase [Nocardioidaceae bacterium]|nr:CocE/NonD family hydrolase [Nocardioidaceae bacterium]